jgi:hypothetical protein
MSDARAFLGTTADDFIQVRLQDTTLLGCVPSGTLAEGFNSITGKSGKVYPVFVAGMPCIVIEDGTTFDPADLPEFVKWAKAPSAKRLRADAAPVSGNDEDIGRPV